MVGKFVREYIPDFSDIETVDHLIVKGTEIVPGEDGKLVRLGGVLVNAGTPIIEHQARISDISRFPLMQGIQVKIDNDEIEE